MRMMIKDILSKNGYEVVGEAENGAKAIEKFKELTPDLVIMDITMPELDGIAAVKEIKKLMVIQNYYVLCYGATGNGYRVYSGWSKGFYC